MDQPDVLQKMIENLGFKRGKSKEIMEIVEHLNGPNIFKLDGEKNLFSVLLNVFVELTIHLKKFEDEIPIIISVLDKNAVQINKYEEGVLYHLKAIKSWKIDNDRYFPSHYLNRSLELLTEDQSPESTQYLGRVYDTYGQWLLSQGLIKDSTTELLKALKVKEKTGDTEGFAITNGNLGRLYMQIGDFENALFYLNADLDLVQKSENRNMNLIGQLLSTISKCYIELQQTAQATQHNDESHQIHLQLNNETGLAFNLLNKAEIALLEDDPGSASIYLTKVDGILKQKSVVRFLLQNLRGRSMEIKARIAHLEGRRKKSNALFHEALQIFEHEYSITKIETAKLLMNFSRLLKESKEPELAGQYLRKALRNFDTTEETQYKTKIEQELKQYHTDSWTLHAAGRYIGHDQINFLLNNAGSTTYVGEEKEVVMLFCDIRGFTALSEKLNPDELISLLNNFLAKMTKVIELYGGFVDKFIGDAIMAVFTLPDPKPDGKNNDAESAVMASLLMKEELTRLNKNLPKSLPELKIGIGIHSGFATTGLIGSPQKRSYTLIGDVVNTASRIEGMTKLLGVDILITKEVFEKMERPDIITKPLGRYCPKGRKQFIDVFSIAGVDDGSFAKKKMKIACNEIANLLDLFRARSFHELENTIQKRLISEQNLTDKTFLNLLMAECKKKQIHPPNENWDGEIILIEK